jgi:hypothetical protein
MRPSTTEKREENAREGYAVCVGEQHVKRNEEKCKLRYNACKVCLTIKKIEIERNENAFT